LFEPVHTTFGKPGLPGDLSNALLGILVKTVENEKRFGRRVGREVARPDPSPEPYKEISTIRLLRRCVSQIIDPKAGL
jgi:hypothetical protein